ncbi:hypothetical protein [Rhodococcus globerulus]|uniref:hypothetical protein n=1 Tax=Rhodococcus globerulus TaxID=33008 RepID=UPI001F47132F|nr:hypothetical protein [Rhodococcus globerulus]
MRILSGELEHLLAVDTGVRGRQLVEGGSGQVARRKAVAFRLGKSVVGDRSNLLSVDQKPSAWASSTSGSDQYFSICARLASDSSGLQPYCLQNFSRRSCVIGSSILIVIVHAALRAAQCVGLFSAQLLADGQTPRQLSAAVRIGFSGDRCTEFVLAAGGGVVEPQGVAIGGFGDGNTPL